MTRDASHPINFIEEITGAGEGIRTLDPDLGKVVPNACIGLQQIDPAYKAYLNQHLAVCGRLPRFAMICAKLLAMC